MSLTHEFILAERARRREALALEKYDNPTPEPRKPERPVAVDALAIWNQINPDPPQTIARRIAALQEIP